MRKEKLRKNLKSWLKKEIEKEKKGKVFDCTGPFYQPKKPKDNVTFSEVK